MFVYVCEGVVCACVRACVCECVYAYVYAHGGWRWMQNRLRMHEWFHLLLLSRRSSAEVPGKAADLLRFINEALGPVSVTR